MHGIYLINKPAGITSHDVVDYLRKITNEKTIGHAGTLDPLASGLMIVAIGREFTKKISNFSKLDKEYIAEATLGATSTTYDKEGIIQDAKLKIKNNNIDQKEIEQVLDSFVGTYAQMPPIFSAKKIKGQKAYDLARQGKPVDLKPVNIKIYAIKLLDYQYPLLKFQVKVSSGTYIRSLIDDVGKKLGEGAYMSGLIRTQIGEYDLSRAINLQQIKSFNDIFPYKIK